MAARSLTPEQRLEADQARRELVEQLHQQLADNIGSLDNRDAWERWLAFSRSFTSYSFANRTILMIQAPHATAVAGYRAWQAKGYQVRRGEKALRILGPVTRPVPMLDPSGRPLLDEHGKPRHTREMIGVKPVSVFDYSQVDGPPAPEAPRPVLLTGQAPPGLWDSLSGFLAQQGYRLECGDCGGANGLTDFTGRVVRVRDDVDEAQAVKTLAHEVGHTLTVDPSDVPGVLDCRGLREVTAEAIAYAVTQAHGLDSGQYTFNYVTGWATQASGTLTPEQVVRATGQRVMDAVDRILAHTQPEPSPAQAALSALETSLDRDPERPRWETITPADSPGQRADRAAGRTRSHPRHTITVGR